MMVEYWQMRQKKRKTTAAAMVHDLTSSFLSCKQVLCPAQRSHDKAILP
jgi:hypothetical protein